MTNSTLNKRVEFAKNFMKQVNKLSAGRQISDKYFGIIKHLHAKSDPTCRYPKREVRLFSVSKSTIMPSGARSITSIRKYVMAWANDVCKMEDTTNV